MNNQIARLKSKISSKGYILHGSLTETFKKCGKTNCRCYTDKKHWHGPYWIWTRKENGKTVTKTLNRKQVILVKKAIKEMKDIDLIIENWKKVSIREIVKV